MAFERVAHFARLAASDGGVLSALQDDPESMRQPLDLSEAQVRALISASAFTSDKPVRTTSRAEDPVGNLTNLMELGTLGTLLPPEGSGAFPAPGDLPPAPLAPISGPPLPWAHKPPWLTPRSSPPATPAPQSAAPTQPSAPTTAPQAAPTSVSTPVLAPQSSGAPISLSPVAAPGIGTGQTSGSPQQTVTTSSGSQGNAGHAGASYGTAEVQTLPAPNTQRFYVPAASGGCGCSCDVGIIAIVAQVSTTAQAAITAITAIAGMN